MKRPVWAVPNAIVARKVEERRVARDKKRIKGMRSTIDTHGLPLKRMFNVAKLQADHARKLQVDAANAKLVKRLELIEERQQTDCWLKRQRAGGRSWVAVKLAQNREIAIENQKLMSRLVMTPSVFDTKQWEVERAEMEHRMLYMSRVHSYHGKPTEKKSSRSTTRSRKRRKRKKKRSKRAATAPPEEHIVYEGDEEDEVELAVVKIQAVIRGRQSRRKVQRLRRSRGDTKAERRATAKAELANMYGVEVKPRKPKAYTSTYRGAPKRWERRVRRRSSAAREEVAAVRIQAAERGRRARRRVDSLRLGGADVRARRARRRSLTELAPVYGVSPVRPSAYTTEYDGAPQKWEVGARTVARRLSKTKARRRSQTASDALPQISLAAPHSETH